MTAAPRKTLILTGASRGIGHSTVKRFSDDGWRVITVSREDVPAECKRDPNWTHHISADLAVAGRRAVLVRMANEALDGDPLSALVNIAGMSPKTPYKERLGCLNGDIGEWREVFELNFFAPIVLARGFAAALARGPGVIVNVTSVAGHAVHPFAGSAYSTSKAALSSLTGGWPVGLAGPASRWTPSRPGRSSP